MKKGKIHSLFIDAGHDPYVSTFASSCQLLHTCMYVLLNIRILLNIGIGLMPSSFQSQSTVIFYKIKGNNLYCILEIMKQLSHINERNRTLCFGPVSSSILVNDIILK